MTPPNAMPEGSGFVPQADASLPEQRIRRASQGAQDRPDDSPLLDEPSPAARLPPSPLPIA